MLACEHFIFLGWVRQGSGQEWIACLNFTKCVCRNRNPPSLLTLCFYDHDFDKTVFWFFFVPFFSPFSQLPILSALHHQLEQIQTRREIPWHSRQKETITSELLPNIETTVRLGSQTRPRLDPGQQSIIGTNTNKKATNRLNNPQTPLFCVNPSL